MKKLLIALFAFGSLAAFAQDTTLDCIAKSSGYLSAKISLPLEDIRYEENQKKSLVFNPEQNEIAEVDVSSPSVLSLMKKDAVILGVQLSRESNLEIFESILTKDISKDDLSWGHNLELLYRAESRDGVSFTDFKKGIIVSCAVVKN
jgi:hypothetical protein